MGRGVILEVSIPLVLKPDDNGVYRVPAGYVMKTTEDKVNYLIEQNAGKNN